MIPVQETVDSGIKIAKLNPQDKLALLVITIILSLGLVVGITARLLYIDSKENAEERIKAVQLTADFWKERYFESEKNAKLIVEENKNLQERRRNEFREVIKSNKEILSKLPNK